MYQFAQKKNYMYYISPVLRTWIKTNLHMNNCKQLRFVDYLYLTCHVFFF